MLLFSSLPSARRSPPPSPPPFRCLVAFCLCDCSRTRFSALFYASLFCVASPSVFLGVPRGVCAACPPHLARVLFRSFTLSPFLAWVLVVLIPAHPLCVPVDVFRSSFFFFVILWLCAARAAVFVECFMHAAWAMGISQLALSHAYRRSFLCGDLSVLFRPHAYRLLSASKAHAHVRIITHADMHIHHCIGCDGLEREGTYP